MVQVAFFGLAAAQNAAQSDSTGIVRGRVIGPFGEVLEGARVATTATKAFATTAADGSFVLTGLPRSRFVLSVIRIGYNAQAIQLDLTRDALWVGVIRMAVGVQRLPDVGVMVRAAKPAEYASTSKYDEVFQHMRIGLGRFISREQIERQNATRTAQLFATIPGAHVDLQAPGAPTRVWFSRCSELPPKISVWIDGRKLIPERQSEALLQALNTLDSDARRRMTSASNLAALRYAQEMIGEMLDRVSPQDIEMIEVYRGVAEIPARYKDDSCAAIAIWTR